jgi:hypothetical protein
MEALLRLYGGSIKALLSSYLAHSRTGRRHSRTGRRHSRTREYARELGGEHSRTRSTLTNSERTITKWEETLPPPPADRILN